MGAYFFTFLALLCSLLITSTSGFAIAPTSSPLATRRSSLGRFMKVSMVQPVDSAMLIAGLTQKLTKEQAVPQF